MKKNIKHFETSPRPWKLYAHGDLGIDILDAEGTAIAHMTGKAGCAFGKGSNLNGTLFGNAKLIVQKVNKSENS